VRVWGVCGSGHGKDGSVFLPVRNRVRNEEFSSLGGGITCNFSLLHDFAVPRICKGGAPSFVYQF
jgi:hypothetical protein